LASIENDQSGLMTALGTYFGASAGSGLASLQPMNISGSKTGLGGYPPSNISSGA